MDYMIHDKEYSIDNITKEEFLNIEKTTVFQSKDSPTGYVVSFRLKAPERSWVGVIGDWMFSDIYSSSHWRSGKYWPHQWKREYFLHTLLGLKQTPAILFNNDEDVKVDPKKFEFDFDILKLGLYEMKKEKTGIFICTIPLPSGSFNYRFVLEIPDGNILKMKTIQDQNNLPQYQDDKEQKYCQILVPFDGERQTEDRSIELPYTGELQGEVIYETYDTDNAISNGIAQHVGIYLPANYDKDRKEAYPILYLSHGGGGCYSDWFTQGALKNIMDHLIADGKVEPMVVVTMDNEILEWKNHSKCIPNIVDYLIPYIERHYNVSSNPKKRAFAGFSAGGFLAFDVFSTFTDVFRYYGIWSGGQRSAVDFNKQEFKLTTVHIGAGRYDDAYYTFGFKLEDALNEFGIPFSSYFPEGAHQWSVWRKLVEDFVKRVLWRAL